MPVPADGTRRSPRSPDHTVGTAGRSVRDQITAITLEGPMRGRWLIGLGISGLLVGLMLLSIIVLFAFGIGIWGNNAPVFWGLAIVTYVWWIGIGNAGTLISALLLLLSADWRNSLNRFAEAMTVFAALCASTLPILHLGRPELFYWLLAYPSTINVWPQFRSPLVWDVFAVPIYLLVSITFWYVGLIPDLASVRDRARHRWSQVFYGVLALGWRGSARHWQHWRRVYRLIAVLAVPLVFSVHSGVAMLYAASQVPGWHTTLFPPFFVIGAMFSGFAVVSMIAVVLRHAFRLENLVTARHLDVLGMVLLASGLATGYGYLMEAFGAWYAGGFERETLADQLAGRYSWSFWIALACNIAVLQALWLRRVRRHPLALFLIALLVAIGMWFERYMLQVVPLYRDFLPSAWGFYAPTFWSLALFAGTIGLFLFLFLLFVRFLPLISIFELEEAGSGAKGAGA